MRKYSLYELQAYVQRVIALNFQEPLWVNAEIVQTKESRGHLYLELVQKKDNSEEVQAQAQAVIWGRNLTKIKQNVGFDLNELLREGTEASLQVEVTYHPIYGLKLIVLNIDPSYTLGRMELLRQETILKLKKEGLLQLNAQLTPSSVLQRIAVISSSGAAGYQDFIEHLRTNEFGYYFDIKLFTSAVQGRQMEEEITNAFIRIDQEKEYFDCVVIIRGGGSRLDLAGFDTYLIASSISRCHLPVLTGIGHETDTTVSDLVAFRSFKTPTAVAHHLISHNAAFEAKLQGLLRTMMVRSQRLYRDQKEIITKIQHQVYLEAKRLSEKEINRIKYLSELFRNLVVQQLGRERSRIEYLHEKIHLLDPNEVLKKGYSLSYVNGRQVSSIQVLKRGELITTVLQDGKVVSTIEKINPYADNQ